MGGSTSELRKGEMDPGGQLVGSIMRVVEKAFAYITRDDELLVFRHVDFPKAGIQVPAGTIQLGESPEAAVLREAHEETGLNEFGPPVHLGTTDFAHRAEPATTARRHFFHLPLVGEAPDRWRHTERSPSEGASEEFLFELYWIDLHNQAPNLALGHDAFLVPLRSAV